VWLPIAAFAALWFDLLRQLSFTWSTNEQYEYGWFVPILAVGLLMRNWSTRPEPRSGSTSIWTTILTGVLFLLLFPIRVVIEINPDWPLPAWAYALTVVSLSLLAVHRLGGSPWLKHFAFPIVFVLTAVQWPYRIEHGLTQGLMQVVSIITVEVLGIFNIPALQRGNLIEISTGVVGVDEACSGIRSFQTTLMIALFLGEHFRHYWSRRLVLLIGGLIFAFILNVGRALFLTWQASLHGVEVVDKYHDGAGLSIVIGCFIGLWLLAGRLKKQAPPEAVSHPLTLATLPKWFCAIAAAAVILALAGTEAWYQVRSAQWRDAVRWSVQFPTEQPGFAEVTLPERTLQLLNFDEGDTATWRTSEGTKWDVFFFRWEPRSIEQVIHARVHRPDRCLPAAGLRLVKDSGVAFFDAGGIALPLRQYTYEVEGKMLHVFFCLWEDGGEKQSGMSTMYGERIRAALVGRRLLGQQTLQMVVSGHQNIEDAAGELRQLLPRLVKRTGKEHQTIKLGENIVE
jgi:exosortase